MKVKRLKKIIDSLPDEAWVYFIIDGDEENSYGVSSYEVGNLFLDRQNAEVCVITLNTNNEIHCTHPR